MGITLNQHATTTAGISGNTQLLAFPAAQLAGGLNIVQVTTNNSTLFASSVADNQNGSYSHAALVINAAGNNSITTDVWYKPGIVACAPGANQVTANFPVAPTVTDLLISEFTGMATSSVLDGIGTGTGNSAALSTSTVTTTNSNDLLYCGGGFRSAFSGDGPGFTHIDTSGYGDANDYKVVSVTGPYSGSMSGAGSDQWACILVAFKGLSLFRNATVII